jgi:Fe-Mn family superoxide dismutase
MFVLPKLPYAYTALAPHMSEDTLRTHHDKHHKAYVDKTNELAQAAGLEGRPLEEVIAAARAKKDQKLFNQSAQAWNHGFFWNCLAPDATHAPSGALEAAIKTKFGAGFRDAFLKQGESHFASGWLWLIADEDGSVWLEDRHDADTPVDQASPILVCDLWEHAYYLDHKNARRAYLETVFDHLLDWRFAEAQYAAVTGKGQLWRYPPSMPKAA